MELPKPYFMINKEWYHFNEKKWCYEITDKAPEKAIKSHKEFYDLLNQNN